MPFWVSKWGAVFTGIRAAADELGEIRRPVETSLAAVLILAIAGMANIIHPARHHARRACANSMSLWRVPKALEYQTIMQYPVRIAINPILSQTSYLIGMAVLGGTVVEIVLNLNTAGPVLWRALLQQDMYTAGAYILILGFLYSVGSLLSDLLLATIDPRIRFGAGGA